MAPPTPPNSNSHHQIARKAPLSTVTRTPPDPASAPLQHSNPPSSPQHPPTDISASAMVGTINWLTLRELHDVQAKFECLKAEVSAIRNKLNTSKDTIKRLEAENKDMAKQILEKDGNIKGLRAKVSSLNAPGNVAKTLREQLGYERGEARKWKKVADDAMDEARRLHAQLEEAGGLSHKRAKTEGEGRRKLICRACEYAPSKLCDGTAECYECIVSGLKCQYQVCQEYKETSMCIQGLSCHNVHDEEHLPLVAGYGAVSTFYGRR